VSGSASAGAACAELEALLRAALAAVGGERLVREAVREEGGALRVAGRPLPREARLVVAAAGKAAAEMAAGLEAAAGARIARGWLVTRDGHAGAAGGLPPARWTVREAGHPVPDARSEAAARELLALAAGTGPGDVLLVLLSGGASALLACPLPGLSRADLAAATQALLGSGAAIDEVNTVRKHLVEVAGGRLALAAGARHIEVLAISDVPGDRPDVIGSGPCAPDPTTFADALAVLARRGLGAAFPAAARAQLAAGARGERPESPKPGDAAFARVRTTLLADNRVALAAAAAEARRRGLAALTLPGTLRGEAREAGRRLAALAVASRPRVPTVLLAGGETTVTLEASGGNGRGGRSQELALAAALALAGSAGITLLAAGTDGSDGPTDAAGACVDGGTTARAAARGLDAQAALGCHDSHSFFRAAGGLVQTGPTGTNVMDLALVRLDPPARGREAVGANLPIPRASESVLGSRPPAGGRTGPADC
jgi:glycerate-2-kinase